MKASCTLVRSAFYMYKGMIREKFDAGVKVLLFLSLLKFNQIMFGVFAEKFRHGGQKPAFHVKRWSFQEWTTLSYKAEVLNFFGNSIVKFTEFGDYFMHGRQNCILHVRRNNFRKVDVGEKNYLLLSLLKFHQNLLGFWEKVRHGGQNCIPCLQMMLPRKKNKSLEKHIIFFWEFERQIYGVWCGSFMHGCQNCTLHVRRNNSRRIWCWVKKFTVFVTFEL